MNKILVSGNSNRFILNNDCYIIDGNNKEIYLDIKGNVYIYIINKVIDSININIEDNSKLDMYCFNKNINNKQIINVDEINNTEFNLNISNINNANNSLIVNNNIKGNNNKSIINGRFISNKDLTKVIINLKIDKDTLDNIAIENLKGINNGGNVQIEPNIICLSNEVSANHATSIGNLNRDMINYLMSKGLEEKDAKNIMLKGFIYGNMDDYIKSLGGDLDA